LPEVVRALAATIGGAVLVLSARGEPMTAKAFRRELSEEQLASLRIEVAARGSQPGNGNGNGARSQPVAFAPEHPELSGRALALPVATRGSGAPQAWLVAARDAGGLGDFERLILQQAVTVVALELMRQRTVRDTERRLAGDVLAEALTGRLEPDELQTRLRPFGVREASAVLIFELDDAAAAEPHLDRFMASAGVGALVATRERHLCAVVDAADGDPLELAARAREALIAEHGEVRAAASRPAPTRALRRSYHEARCALEASTLTGAGAPDVACYKDLGAFQLLLSLQDEDALRLYCDNLLGPLENGEGDYGDELMRSLEAFIEQNGQWERAARQLFCHRHTLRYRIRRIEELTGRDLSRARDRIEFWLALRGRELIR
jgi:purine catabolism regulator